MTVTQIWCNNCQQMREFFVTKKQCYCANCEALIGVGTPDEKPFCYRPSCKECPHRNGCENKENGGNSDNKEVKIVRVPIESDNPPLPDGYQINYPLDKID